MTIDDVKTICVTGAGQMGSQIAMQAALHGYKVVLHDIAEEQLKKAFADNKKLLDRRVEKGKLTQDEVDAAFARMSSSTSIREAVREADYVIEAIVEVLDEKKAMFRELDQIVPVHAILATNSSYTMNSEIAGETTSPEKVINMHFFYPPLVMDLVEVVKGEKTSMETVEITAELARRIGKEPVVLYKEMPGFLVNRILRAITNEAYSLLENGVATFEDIDRACELGLRHPMGPFKLGDFSGLDIGYNARLEVFNKTGKKTDKPPESLERRVKRGDLGRKTGRGFYDYSTDPPTPIRDEEPAED